MEMLMVEDLDRVWKQALYSAMVMEPTQNDLTHYASCPLKYMA